jgi:hypothetical protein
MSVKSGTERVGILVFRVSNSVYDFIYYKLVTLGIQFISLSILWFGFLHSFEMGGLKCLEEKPN